MSNALPDNTPAMIYKHVFPNNKVYIGITTKNKDDRWGKNGIGYKSQFVYKAIKKYGWNNIKHVVIKENISLKEAKLLEQELIKIYKSNDSKYGYNINPGGDINTAPKTKCYCYNKEGKLLFNTIGYRKMSELTGITICNIASCCNHKQHKRANGLIFSNKKLTKDQISKIIIDKTNDKYFTIYCYDKYYNLTIANSYKDLASKINMPIETMYYKISKDCKNPWEYILSKEPLTEEEWAKRFNFKKIYYYDDLELVKVFKSKFEANLETGVKIEDILRYCNKEVSRTIDYKVFSYEPLSKEDLMFRYKEKYKLVYAYDKKGLIKIYKNVTECKNDLKVSRSQIYYCCNGITLVAKRKYTFNYKELTDEELKLRFKKPNNTSMIEKNSKKVLCIETNEVFKSMSEAAKKYGTNCSCLIAQIKEKKKSAGKLKDGTKLHWKLVEDKQ